MSCSYSSSTFLHYFLFILFFHVQPIKARIILPPNVNVPAVLGFGDSIIDPGNNNNLPTIAKCNFPPYGRNFEGGKSTGRFSNGRIPTDLLAEELGIKDFLPAYLDPTLTAEDLLTGVSFASGGVGYDPLTSQLAGAIKLSDQINYFTEYIEKLKALVGEERTKSIITNSLYLVVVGSNDIANTYFDLPTVKLTYDVSAYTDLMIQGASTIVEELYNMGARRIGVFSVPPLGCLPSQRTLDGGLQRQCSEKRNQAALMFNAKLSSTLNRLNTNFINAMAVYIDIYNPIFDIVKNPSKYGIEVVERGCCGIGKIEVIVLCNDLNPFTCSDASKYLFWDSYHPTERGYEILTNMVVKKYVEELFCIGIPCS